VAGLAQLAVVGYAFATITGGVGGVQGRTSGSYAQLGWVDAHAAGHTVTWLEDLASVQPPALDLSAAGLASDQVHVTLFWNSQLGNTATVPAADSSPLEFPLTGLPTRGALSVERQGGTLQPLTAAAGMQDVIEESASPFLQLAGRTLALSPDHFLALAELYRPVRATWVTEGLQPDGAVSAGEPVRFSAWPPSPRATAPAALSITMALTAPRAVSGAQPHTSVTVRVGRIRRIVRLTSATSPSVLNITACAGRETGSVSGTIDASGPAAIAGRQLGGILQAATVTVPSQAPAGCPAS
jgi:hypothetical protein